MHLSREVIVVRNTGKYTIADLMIEVGGISRTLHVIGLGLAHFVALKLLRKALIEDMFLINHQKEDDKDAQGSTPKLSPDTSKSPSPRQDPDLGPDSGQLVEEGAASV